MKGITLIGIFLLVLGVVALVVPIPRRESHGVKIDDTKIGIQTESREKVPPAVGIVLIGGGPWLWFSAHARLRMGYALWRIEFAA